NPAFEFLPIVIIISGQPVQKRDAWCERYQHNADNPREGNHRQIIPQLPTRSRDGYGQYMHKDQQESCRSRAAMGHVHFVETPKYFSAHFGRVEMKSEHAIRMILLAPITSPAYCRRKLGRPSWIGGKTSQTIILSITSAIMTKLPRFCFMQTPQPLPLI